MKPTGSYKGKCPKNIALAPNEKQTLWIQTIIDEIGAETGREAINYALRESYYKIAGDNGIFHSVKGNKKLGRPSLVKKQLEEKLKGDTEICNTEGTIILRREDYEGDMTIFVDYPIIDRPMKEDGTTGDIAIVDWRSSLATEFKREFIFGDLDEADYLLCIEMLKSAVLEKSFK